jgi:hypothetical protein
MSFETWRFGHRDSPEPLIFGCRHTRPISGPAGMPSLRRPCSLNWPLRRVLDIIRVQSFSL